MTRLSRYLQAYIFLLFLFVLSLFSLLPAPKNSTKKLETVEAPPQLTTETALFPTNSPSVTERKPLTADPVTAMIPMQYTETGLKDFEALARLGHHETRLVQASFTDLLAKDLPDAALAPQKPTDEEVERQLQATQDAINRILENNTKTGGVAAPNSASIVKFTPHGSEETKIVKVVEMPKDPFDPPKFKHKRAPKPPPSPPPPVLHSPPRKASAVEQKAWYIPPSVSNWKNPKGYTIALDKRLASDGRGLVENRINEGFSTFAESLYLAERHAREEVEKRAVIEGKLADKERSEQEETLRALAQKAREEKAALAGASQGREAALEESDSLDGEDTEESKFGPIRVHGAEKNLSLKEREELRRQMSRQHERDYRVARMGQEARAKHLARAGDRDVSEQAALGKEIKTNEAAPSTESVFDARLFDQTAGIGQGLHDDEAYNIYDKPLFGGSAVHMIYRPSLTGDDALDEGAEESAEPVDLKRASKAFQGAEVSSARAGPVEFERDEEADTADPFGLDSFLSEAKKRSAGTSTSAAKRAR
jgi:SNW domain-containing protein 1